MSEGIAELDELHTAAENVLAAIREVVEHAQQVGERLAQRKQPTKTQTTAIAKSTAQLNSVSWSYPKLVQEDRFIKVSYLLLDTFVELHQASTDNPSKCPVWRMIQDFEALHCHSALWSVAERAAGNLRSRSDGDWKALAALADHEMLRVVTGSDFAEFFIGEYDAAHQFLSTGYGPYPLSTQTRHNARMDILEAMNYHALGCAELAHRFVDDFCIDYDWSKSEYVAGRQAERRWERVESATLNLTKHASRFREVPDESEMLEMIREANVDDLREIAVHDRTFATAHEAIDSIDYVIDDIVDGLDGFTDEDSVVELAEALKNVEIPDLTARLLIEKTKTKNWLKAQYKGEREREQQDEAAEERRRLLDDQIREMEELEEADSGDDQGEVPTQPPKRKPRRQWPTAPPAEESRHTFGPLAGTLTRIADVAEMSVPTLYANNGTSFFYIRRITGQRYQVWLDSQKMFAIWNRELGDLSG